MRTGRAGHILIIWLVGLCLVLGLPLLAQGAALQLKIEPPEIEIDAFFQGAELVIEGEIPAGAGAVLEVVGQEQTEHLMRKGRRLGLWMNVGELEVQHAPGLYLAAATNPQLLTSPSGEAAWGYAALKKRLTVTGQVGSAGAETVVQQFLDLKESEGLYGAGSRPLEVSAGGKLRGVFNLPGKIRPGTYRVCLWVLEQGKAAAPECVELEVRQVGFPAMLASLAYQHAALYGILAVVIAIVTGFLMGYLFGGKGGGH